MLTITQTEFESMTGHSLMEKLADNGPRILDKIYQFSANGRTVNAWQILARGRKTGRVNELKLGLQLYFMNGIGEGIKTSLKMKDIGLGMLKTGRMNPMEILGGHAVKDLSGFHKAIKKAQELEDARVAKHGR